MELGTPTVMEWQSPVLSSWVETRIYPTTGGVTAYFHDISERKRKEEEREQLLAQQRRQTQLGEALNAINGAVSSQLETSDVLEEVLRLAGEAFGCDAGNVALRDGDEWRMTHIWNMPAKLLGRRFSSEDVRHGELALSEQRPIWLADYRNEPLGYAAVAEKYRVAASLAIPLIVDGEGVGCLFFTYYDSPHSFSEMEVDFARKIGAVVSQAQENTRLFKDLRESQEAERFLADVVDKAEVPFGVGSPDGRLILFNQAFADLTGYSQAELEEMALTSAVDLTPPQWREAESSLLAQAVAARHAVRYEKEYLRKDGSRVPIELFVQPIFDEAGALLHYRSFLTDISERKQAEQRLLARETEAARLDQELPGSRTTRLVGRFRGHRWSVLIGAIAIQSAILVALNTAPNTRHVLGLPGSLIALICVVAGALAGPLVGALVAVAGGGVFYLTVGGRGSHSTVLTIMISAAIWVTAGLLSGFLAKTLSEQAERRRVAAVSLVRADAAREAQLAEQARIEELPRDSSSKPRTCGPPVKSLRPSVMSCVSAHWRTRGSTSVRPRRPGWPRS